MAWYGPVNGDYVGEMFRVEIDATGVDLIWFDPNPHAGHEGGEHHSLGDFLGNAGAHEVIARILGDGPLAEILQEVRRRLV